MNVYAQIHHYLSLCDSFVQKTGKFYPWTRPCWPRRGFQKSLLAALLQRFLEAASGMTPSNPDA